MAEWHGSLAGLAMKSSFWQGKKVFLTGHTGFKGSWLALWLQKLGAEVTGYALQPPTSPSLFDLAGVARGMTSLRGDVRDLKELLQVMEQQKPEIVIHMAAQSLVRYSYTDPVETFASNLMGTVNLLEASRQCGGVRAILCVTTDKCYENREWDWGYRENEAMGGHDPYSASKGCAELAAAAYRQSFFAGRGAALATARAGNVIGGGDWAQDRLVPDMIRAFMENRPVVIRNPRATRPWQHVLESLAGYMSLVEKLCDEGDGYAEGWNFGPRDDETRPVDWVVETLARNWGEGADWVLDGGDHPHEAHYLKLDCSKAHTRLGWQPRLSLSQALEWTVQWYRAFQQQGDLRRMTLQQIDRYQELTQS